MTLLRGVKLTLWGLGGLVSLVLGAGILLFDGVVIIRIAANGGSFGKDPILVLLIAALGGALTWIGLRELVRLIRVLQGTSTRKG